MLDITRTPMARTIALSLNHGQPIQEVAVSTDRVIDVAGFVETLFPGQEIEHLARPYRVATGRAGRMWATSSLFFQAVHSAYCCHHALGLRPEVLMYLINSVVAETVRRYPEDYRHLFTTRAGRMDIHVRHDDLLHANSDRPWDEAIELFGQALRPHVPGRVMNQLLPEFTTASNELRLASLIAFMDAASPYYDYHLYTLCGIPRIVLFGETADYRRLVIAARELAGSFHKHLAIYFANLLPVLETIAETAKTGQIDPSFWGQIYKHFERSGTSCFSGWISSFLWYVHKADVMTKTNPLVVKDATLADWRAMHGRDAIDSRSEPSHVSSVPFMWHVVDRVFPMRFIAGVLGVDCTDGALTPVLSYGVLSAA